MQGCGSNRGHQTKCYTLQFQWNMNDVFPIIPSTFFFERIPSTIYYSLYFQFFNLSFTYNLLMIILWKNS